MNRMSIFLVEDHKLMAESLVRAFHQQAGFEISNVAESAEDAWERLPNLNVDLALVDVVLPRKSGIELVSMIQKKYPTIPCLMISGRTSGHYVKNSLKAGARGYVLKDDIHDVIFGVGRVLQGGTYVSKQIVEEA